jgi:hypothetical protein
MPSFIKHSIKGVQKPQIMHKLLFQPIQKSNTYLSKLLPQNWFPIFSSPPPLPVSSVFESHDCIWYHGTLYVRENVAVTKLLEQQAQQAQQQQPHQHQQQQENHESLSTQTQDGPQMQTQTQDFDDDSESISSANSGNNPKNIGKQNQLKYLKDGMRLRHLISEDHWYATFDAETNRVIRTPDGVAFDTLRQFARLHCNEVLGTTDALNNVWSDSQFHYQDDEGEWHPLSKLKH